MLSHYLGNLADSVEDVAVGARKPRDMHAFLRQVARCLGDCAALAIAAENGRQIEMPEPADLKEWMS